MKREANLAESALLTVDGVVKSGLGYVYSITIAWRNCAAGDRCTLQNAVAAGGTSLVAFCFPTTSGTITKEWPEGKEFSTGIYWNQSILPAGGAIWTELTFR